MFRGIVLFFFLGCFCSLHSETILTLNPGSALEFKDLPAEGRVLCPNAKTECLCQYVTNDTFHYHLVKVVNGTLVPLEPFRERPACIEAKKAEADCQK